jgi:TonB family protein
MTILSVHQMSDASVNYSAVAQSSGSAELDEAARTCVSATRLRPITQDGEPIEVTWKRAVVWRAHGLSSIIIPQLPGERVQCVSPQFLIRETVVAEVSFQIGTDGIPKNAKIVQSTGNFNLDRTTLECIVPSFRFFAATQQGNPIEIDWRTAVTWKGR